MRPRDFLLEMLRLFAVKMKSATSMRLQTSIKSHATDTLPARKREASPTMTFGWSAAPAALRPLISSFRLLAPAAIQRGLRKKAVDVPPPL